MNNQLIIIKNDFDFVPQHTFTCGQCFRWIKQSDQSYTGVAHERVINVSLSGDSIVLKGTDANDFNQIWRDYFDLGRDYSKIKAYLSSKDRFLFSAIKYGYGIHILKQDFFETLLSFIISSNNNIPRIQSIINAFSKSFGNELLFDGKTYFSFPTHDKLYGIEKGDLSPFRMGYRDEYIIDAINKFSALSYDEILNVPICDARKILYDIKGVGPKVADCILLFAFGRFEVFPCDVWVKRLMNELYGCEPSKAAITGSKMFGNLAGIAQQYLFYQRREGGNLA